VYQQLSLWNIPRFFYFSWWFYLLKTRP